MKGDNDVRGRILQSNYSYAKLARHLEKREKKRRGNCEAAGRIRDPVMSHSFSPSENASWSRKILVVLEWHHGFDLVDHF